MCIRVPESFNSPGDLKLFLLLSLEHDNSTPTFTAIFHGPFASFARVDKIWLEPSSLSHPINAVRK
jgi:hypothetical protein